MSRSILFVVFPMLLSLAALATPTAAQQDFAAAKELYTAAKYEEALAVLDQLKEAKPAASDAALGIEQYRAMCLLALNRKPEAEQAIEAVADLDPFYQPAEDDAAPWIREAFRETRRKVLPSALQRLYGHAKDAYNKKDMAEAVVAFGRVLKILDDPDLTLDKSAQGDMKMVAQGFIDLAHAAATPTPTGAPPTQTGAPPAQSSATPTPNPPTALPAPTSSSAGTTDKGAAASPAAKPAGSAAKTEGPTVYDVSSQNVTPPMPIRRDVPTWNYGPRAVPGTAVIVELIVRENGTIESAIVRQSAGKYYDEMVSQAARSWLYRPAVKGGQPVRYRLLVKVIIGRESEPGGPA